MKIKDLIKKSSVILTIVLVLSGTLFFAKPIKAYSYNDLCSSWMEHQHFSLTTIPTLIRDIFNGNMLALAKDIVNGTISTKTNEYINNACKLDGDYHGGHGGTIPESWQQVKNSAEDDLKNGSNKNYYTNTNYNTTNNYSVINNSYDNTSNEYTSINYTYNNQSYNYSYNINNSYYNSINNSYTFELTNNSELTVINNYNNTTVIDSGSERVLYYMLPDGSNSLNLNEDQAKNGFKTSLSVNSYNNSYDNDDLIALYHFDGNENDSAYPTETTLSFDRNSVQFIGSSTPFKESLALFENSTLTVNKNNAFVSFRFYPLISDHWSITLNNTLISSRDSYIDTTYDYVEWVQNTYGSNSTNHAAGANAFAITKVFASTPSQPHQAFPNITGYTKTLSTATTLPNNGGFEITAVYNRNAYTESSTISTLTTQRTYNIINNKLWEDQGSNLINYNMWNYLTINLDGSVYINGNDTNIDVDNTLDLNIAFGGDSVTYIDELALFHSNRSNYSPFYPYDSNIVYSVPNYYQEVSYSGIKYNQLSNINYDNDVSLWGSRPYLNFINDHIYFIRYYTQLIDKGNLENWTSRILIQANNVYYTFGILNNSYELNHIDLYVNLNNYTNFQYIFFYGSGNNTLGPGTSKSLNKLNIFDLTMMFGSGFEPSEAEFKEFLNNYYNNQFNPTDLNGTLIKNPSNLESNYTYTENILIDSSKNNELLIQSIIPVSGWKFGGYRPSSPSYGYVFVSVDDLGFITSVQQFNGNEWVSVNGGIFNDYLGKWVNSIGFNIFNMNWDISEYQYKSDDPDTNLLVRFFSNRFDDLHSWIENISLNISNVFSVSNEYNTTNNNVINNSTEINNYSEQIHNVENDVFNQFDQTEQNMQLYQLDAFGDKLINSENWVKTQFNRFIYDEENNLNPIGILMGFALTMGIIMLILGRKV